MGDLEWLGGVAVVEAAAHWLTTVASRICLDLLGSARARRERYVGQWIPEPLPEPLQWPGGRVGGTALDPADQVTLDESVAMAFLVVLDSMTPAERVAFLLHDVLCYPFSEVARSPAARRASAATWPPQRGATLAPPGLSGASTTRQRGSPASSGTSSGHGKPGPRPPQRSRRAPADAATAKHSGVL